jgi:hypothetical protein
MHPRDILGPSGGQIDTLLALRPHLHIKHHVPGRLRVRFGTIPPGLIEDSGEEALAAFRALFRGVHDVSLNPFSRSVLITYDSRRMAPTLLDEFFNAASAGDAAKVLCTLAEHP